MTMEESADAPLVDLSVEGAVAVVRLVRPPVNALSEELCGQLVSAFEECRSDRVRAVVVTGHPHFAAGADIKAFREAQSAGSRGAIVGRLRDAVAALEELAKPTIAAVHGYALGGGLELALAADFRFLSHDATVGQPEILLGLVPGSGGTQRLPRLIGMQASRDLIYSGRHVDADEALRLGLADRLAPSGELLDVALAEAARWATGATRAIGAAKRAIIEGLGRPAAEGMEIERLAFEEVFWSEDGAEGVAAFVDKREPHFRNR